MKRLVAAFLWFQVGWYAGAATAWVVGLDGALAPALALAAAGLMVADPRRIIWATRAPASAKVTPEAA